MRKELVAELKTLLAEHGALANAAGDRDLPAAFP